MLPEVDYNIEYAHIYADQFAQGEEFGEEHLKSIELTKDLVKRLETEGKTYCLCVLIDNYNAQFSLNQEQIFNELGGLGLSPDFIVEESLFAKNEISEKTLAQHLIESLSDKYVKKAKEKTALAIQSNNILGWANSNKKGFKEMFVEAVEKGENALEDLEDKSGYNFSSQTVLQYQEEQNTMYTCPLLTACWHLTRLGVKPFDKAAKHISVYSGKPFFGEKLITVLPSKYIKIEGMAMEIVSLAKSKTIKKKKNKMEYLFF
ncbi:MAG: hypothetical protein KKE23_03955 [Nanoarchaeota archaeon]|nr:hypothetical protein [Nanoarchaeota archaeon]